MASLPAARPARRALHAAPAPPPSPFLATWRRRRHGATQRSRAAAAAQKKSQNRVLVPVATGTEEMEAVVLVDVLRRAGASVIMASVEESRAVTCSRGVRIVADATMSEVVDETAEFDAVVLPGGMPGTKRLRDSEALCQLIEKHDAKDGLLGAICAAPAVVLRDIGLLDGKRATCHPDFQRQLATSMSFNGTFNGRTVVDGNVVTSQGPGTAFEFALLLVEEMFGRVASEEVARPMLVPSNVNETMLTCFDDVEAYAKPHSPSTPKVLVPIANGTEEMEAVILVDVLRRAGIEVIVASVEKTMQVTAANRVTLQADCSISDCQRHHIGSFDGIFLPGGMPGAERLRDSSVLMEILGKHKKDNRLYGAICAAPVVALQSQQLLEGLHATCHPSFIDELKMPSEGRVVIDKNCITSRGPGTAIEFALFIVSLLVGPEKMKEVAKPLVMWDSWNKHEREVQNFHSSIV